MGKDIVATGPEGGCICGGNYSINNSGSVATFPVNKDNCNHSSHREGFASIMEAVEDICHGKMVIVVSDEDRETKGFLVLAASLISHEAVDFLVKHGTGIVYVTMKGKDLERLQLHSMDVQHEVPSSVSSRDMATTIFALASRQPNHEDFCRGPIFLRKYREGGVLERTGHTEAAVDLAVLAGVEPIGVSCELVTNAGSRERLVKLHEFASNENLKIISITDLVRHRRMNEKLVEFSASARMPTMWGTFVAQSYRSVLDGIEHVAMIKGEIGDGQDVLVRVHSECLTGDIFGSARCDCGNQLALAMQLIERAGRGVLVYNRGHEGRGIGLGNKLRAYNLQDAGVDTVDANIQLGLPVDSREYHISAQILRHLGVQSVRLLTNNPAKCTKLRSLGVAIINRIPVITTITQENKRYLETKRTKMNHMFDLGSGSFDGEVGKRS